MIYTAHIPNYPITVLITYTDDICVLSVNDDLAGACQTPHSTALEE